MFTTSPPYVDEGGNNVQVKKLIFSSEGRPDIELDLTGEHLYSSDLICLGIVVVLCWDLVCSTMGGGRGRWYRLLVSHTLVV